MLIKMPVVCGIQSHANLMRKVDKAVAENDFPIDLDCANTTFTTSGFVRFVVSANKKIRERGGSLRLLNVDDAVWDGLCTTSLANVIEVTRKTKVRDSRGRRT